MNLNYEIEVITRENLFSYQHFILSDVLPELAGIPEDSIGAAILCGAKLDGQPCGAIACTLVENEMFIISIYVASSLRRNNIGSSLFEYACALALGESSITNNYQQLQINCEYSLPEPDATELKAFFKSVGFNNFTENDPIYSVRPQHFDKAVAVTAITEFEKEARDELLSINEDVDMIIVPELSFVEEDAENTKQILLTQDLGDSTYLVSTTIELDTSEEEYEIFVRSALSRILDYDSKATVLLRAEDTAYDNVWNKLAQESGTRCTHIIASAYRIYNYGD